MKVLGEEITQIAQNDVRGYMAFEETFTTQGVRKVIEANLPYLDQARRSGVAMRAADYLIQREKLAGRIESTGEKGKWRWKP